MRDGCALTARTALRAKLPPMTTFLATVLASLAAAAIFTLAIPADAATADWELPFTAAR
jgi:hypothetical protein